MRHSASPRITSATRKAKRPAWPAARMNQRPASLRRSSVSSAPRAATRVSCVRMPRSSTPRARKPKNAQGFTRRLLAWYAAAARDLPWRRTRDPYRVLVSEVMLQQTQVSRVAQYYPRFLERFPDLQTLARARPRAVREAWDGLGYYARVRNLHQLARQVVRGEEAKLPSDPAELVKLPGVGRYTAGAVATFAYEKPVPAVDTNVRRGVQRAFGNAGRGMGEAGVWGLGSALGPKGRKRAGRGHRRVMGLGG